MSTAADRDEQAELRVLREATARSAAEAADTVGALAGRARATAARARGTARRARRPALLGLSAAAVLLTAGLLVLRRYHAAR